MVGRPRRRKWLVNKLPFGKERRVFVGGRTGRERERGERLQIFRFASLPGTKLRCSVQTISFPVKNVVVGSLCEGCTFNSRLIIILKGEELAIVVHRREKEESLIFGTG